MDRNFNREGRKVCWGIARDREKQKSFNHKGPFYSASAYGAKRNAPLAGHFFLL